MQKRVVEIERSNYLMSECAGQSGVRTKQMTGGNIKVISRYRDSFGDSGYLWVRSGTDRSNGFRADFVGRVRRRYEYSGGSVAR